VWIVRKEIVRLDNLFGAKQAQDEKRYAAYGQEDRLVYGIAYQLVAGIGGRCLRDKQTDSNGFYEK
jgi:hypothetical protein